MYTASDDASLSSAWTPVSRQTPVRNHYHEVPKVRWSDLRNLRHLADGAMCSCYTAELDGVTVVIKRPKKNSRETREEIERQLDIEKAYLSRLRHPHIIRLLGAGTRGLSAGLEPFLVLEYLEGGTLGQLIKERREGGGETVEEGVNRRRAAFELPHFVDGTKNYIPWKQAMGWARDMAQALKYMHEDASASHIYVCRDLKPDNIGFTADGTLKIFDFGLAKRVTRRSEPNQAYTMTSRTGTIRYMAPEAFQGFLYNEKVDVYAWSHVAAEMLSLDMPYENMSMEQFRSSVALGSKRPHVERRWPQSIKSLLRRCWKSNPEERPSFREILEAGILEHAAGPSHPWLSFFGAHRPHQPIASTQATPEWRAAAVTSTAARAAAAKAVEVRTKITSTAKDRNVQEGHPPQMWHQDDGGAHHRTRSQSHSELPSTTWIHIGPVRLPMCFFGVLPHHADHTRKGVHTSDSDDETVSNFSPVPASPSDAPFSTVAGAHDAGRHALPSHGR